MKKHIPNTITLCNLSCGCFGIVSLLEKSGSYTLSFYLIVLALIFDFLDGFIARILKVSSPIGKELDSLADMVTFGVFPSVIMYRFMTDIACQSEQCTGLLPKDYFAYSAFIIALFSALRLAKFNVDTRQEESFIGLPTPANAIFIASLPLIYFGHTTQISSLLNPPLLLVTTLVASYALVAELPLFSLKVKKFSIKEYPYQFTFILLTILLASVYQVVAIPFIIITYLILSCLKLFVKRKE